NYFNQLWLICLFLISCQISYAQITVQLKHNQEFTYNLKKGTFSLYQNNQPIIENGFSSYSLEGSNVSKQLNSANARELKQNFKYNAGDGICYSIEHPVVNGLKAIQIFYFYNDSSFFVLEVVLKGKKMSTNTNESFNIKTQYLYTNKFL